MSTTLRGISLLRDPRLNKSTAFTESEREALGLVGLVPEGIDSEDTQIQRVLFQLGQKPTDLEKYIYLSQLQDMDETLFYRLLMSDPAPFLPIVYTPTVGEACMQFGHIVRRPKGLYVSIKRKGTYETFSEIGRNAMCVSLWLPAVSEFLGSATSAPTGWASRSENWRYIPHAPAYHRNTHFPSLWIVALTTRPSCAIRSISDFARRARRSQS